MNINANNVLGKFISAMNVWELTYYPLIRDNGMLSVKDKMRNELDEIFDVFCTKKERKQGRQVALSCTEPPTYSPDEEVIKKDESKNKITIYTQQHTGLKNQYRYTLQFKNDKWLLDKKERFSDYENKWIKDNL